MKLSVMTVCRWISVQYKSSYISMYVLWLLLIATAVAQDVASCNLTSYFSCHGDCCVRGEMLCHEKEQRCVLCENKKELCGTDREPRDCYLYCYKQKQKNTTIKEEDGMYFTTAMLVAGVVGIVLLSFGAGALSAVCCYSKYKKKQRLGSSATVHDQDGQEQELEVVETGGQDTDAKPLLCKGQQPSRSTLTSEATGSDDTIGSTEETSMRLTKREGTDNDHNVNNDNPSPSMTSRSSSPTSTTPLRAVPPERARPAAPPTRAPEQPIQDPHNGVFPVGGEGPEVNSVHETPAVQAYAGGGEGYTAANPQHPQHLTGHNKINFSAMQASTDEDNNGQRTIHTGTQSRGVPGNVTVA